MAGIVEHVVVMGAPVSTRLERWAMARSVVAGRFVNAYSRRDWMLGLIYRGANGEFSVWNALYVPSNAVVCIVRFASQGSRHECLGHRDWVVILINRGTVGISLVQNVQ